MTGRREGHRAAFLSRHLADMAPRLATRDGEPAWWNVSSGERECPPSQRKGGSRVRRARASCPRPSAALQPRKVGLALGEEVTANCSLPPSARVKVRLGRHPVRAALRR